MINVKLLAFFVLTCLIACKQSIKLEDLDALLKKTYPAGQPGAAVGIVENGQLVFEKYYGIEDLRDSTPVSDSTSFNIASITKQFTACAILQLHAFDYDVLKAVEKMDSLYFTPGTHYRYSNTAYCLLALIIEQVSGHEFRQHMKRYIFEPMRMYNTDVLNMEKLLKNRAMGYAYDSTKKQFSPSDARENVFFTTQGDGGIYTSLRDYVKWFNELQKETGLIEQARHIQYLIDGSKQLGYGYGWFVGALQKPELVYHTGSNGGFRAIVVTIPSENYALIIFSNRTGIDLENLAVEINRIFNKENKSLQRIESLISFNDSWPIFAPCKKIPWFSILSTKSSNVKGMA